MLKKNKKRGIIGNCSRKKEENRKEKIKTDDCADFDFFFFLFFLSCENFKNRKEEMCSAINLFSSIYLIFCYVSIYLCIFETEGIHSTFLTTLLGGRSRKCACGLIWIHGFVYIVRRSVLVGVGLMVLQSYFSY